MSTKITGKFLYDSYRKAAGYKSKYTGDPLPEFEDVHPEVQAYWNQTAEDVNAKVNPKPKPMKERPDGGPV